MLAHVGPIAAAILSLYPFPSIRDGVRPENINEKGLYIPPPDDFLSEIEGEVTIPVANVIFWKSNHSSDTYPAFEKIVPNEELRTDRRRQQRQLIIKASSAKIIDEVLRTIYFRCLVNGPDVPLENITINQSEVEAAFEKFGQRYDLTKKIRLPNTYVFTLGSDQAEFFLNLLAKHGTQFDFVRQIMMNRLRTAEELGALIFDVQLITILRMQIPLVLAEAAQNKFREEVLRDIRRSYLGPHIKITEEMFRLSYLEDMTSKISNYLQSFEREDLIKMWVPPFADAPNEVYTY